jgi:hypothetical protein
MTRRRAPWRRRLRGDRPSRSAGELGGWLPSGSASEEFSRKSPSQCRMPYGAVRADFLQLNAKIEAEKGWAALRDYYRRNPPPYSNHYNPNQPRVPSGHPDGGQWTREASGSEPAAIRDVAQHAPAQSGEVLNDADPASVEAWAQYAQLVPAPVRASVRFRSALRFPGANVSQLVRLDIAEFREAQAIRESENGSRGGDHGTVCTVRGVEAQSEEPMITGARPSRGLRSSSPCASAPAGSPANSLCCVDPVEALLCGRGSRSIELARDGDAMGAVPRIPGHRPATTSSIISSRLLSILRAGTNEAILIAPPAARDRGIG